MKKKFSPMTNKADTQCLVSSRRTPSLLGSEGIVGNSVGNSTPKGGKTLETEDRFSPYNLELDSEAKTDLHQQILESDPFRPVSDWDIFEPDLETRDLPS